MVEKIEYSGSLYALILRASYKAAGTQFFTDREATFQIAHFGHGKGKVFPTHQHKAIERQISLTQEVLIIKSGKLKADIYDDDRRLLRTTVLEAGDIILICKGGHGFEVLTDDFSMVEVKQGPYLGVDDKVVFDGTRTSEHATAQWPGEGIPL